MTALNQPVVRRLTSQLGPSTIKPPPLAARWVDIISWDSVTRTAQCALGGDAEHPVTMMVANPAYLPRPDESMALAIQQGGDYFLIGGINASGLGDLVELEPDSAIDTGSPGSFETWLDLGSLDVPTRTARYTATISSAYIVTAETIGRVRLSVGSQKGRAHTVHLDENQRDDIAWQSRINNLTRGVQSITIEYVEDTGGAFRVDDKSLIAVSFDWEP